MFRAKSRVVLCLNSLSTSTVDWIYDTRIASFSRFVTPKLTHQQFGMINIYLIYQMKHFQYTAYTYLNKGNATCCSFLSYESGESEMLGVGRRKDSPVTQPCMCRCVDLPNYQKPARYSHLDMLTSSFYHWNR